MEQTIQSRGKPNAAKLKRHFNANKGEPFPWVYESPRDANAQPFANLDKAFQCFFNKEAKRPRFKKKNMCRDAFYVANDKFRVDDKTLTLSRLGKVNMREALRFQSKITSATVSWTADRWFVPISVETDVPTVVSENQASVVGVDLGVKNLATLSDRTTVKGPKPLQSSLKRVARLNRSLSRKELDSRDWAKTKLRVARCHARIASVRSDGLHKLTTRLTQAYACVVIEDLNVKGMMGNRQLSRVISDMGFSEFRRQLNYKTEPIRTEVIVADGWYPSSKLCRVCNCLHETLTLKDRIFECSFRGHVDDPDLNAACSLERYPRLIGKSDAFGHPSAGLAARLPGETRMVEAGIQDVPLVVS